MVLYLYSFFLFTFTFSSEVIRMADLFEINNIIENAELRIKELHHSLKIAEKNIRLQEIDARMAENDFWNDPSKAQDIVQERKAITSISEPYARFTQDFTDAVELLELGKEENDSATIDEASDLILELQESLKSLETMALLSEPHDEENAFFSINTGAGGSDACECAQMLLRMYTRFFDSKGWSVETLSFIEGDEAGIKSVDLRVSGEYVYGMLKSELGVHRLVRISPFSGKRETSFAAVDVVPDFRSEINIEIDENDLRIDTYRAGGKGGQHVNTTDSAVRITHLPTNIVVAVQNERSQHSNKAMALDILKSRLYAYEENKRLMEANEHNSAKMINAWGSQIRNYVMHPYTLVKDVRTEYQTGNIQGVLDGNVEPFIDAYLRLLSSKK